MKQPIDHREEYAQLNDLEKSLAYCLAFIVVGAWKIGLFVLLWLGIYYGVNLTTPLIHWPAITWPESLGAAIAARILLFILREARK